MEGEIHYPSNPLEREISNLIKVWVSVVVSLCYCYFSAKFVPKGMPRFFSIIPVVCVFLVLPLKLNSANLAGTTGFFIAWLSNFKLLLFAFDKGPLSGSGPPLSLRRFIAIACFPIRIQQNPNPNTIGKGNKSIWNYALKVVLLALFVRIYDYGDQIQPKIILVLYCFHIYMVLEITLAMAAFVARAVFGFELEPHFDEPYLSTSLQDFWGRRWNLVVSRTLRPTVYDPILCISANLIGRKWASLPAVMSTFVVSALMHELMFYYMGRLRPTWEITCFFLLHGACLVVEIGIKKKVNGRWCGFPRVISTPMTVGFLLVTSLWLFFPQLLKGRIDERSLEEYALVGAFLKNFIAGVLW